MDSKTILIADDHPIFRHGLRDILDSTPGLKVIGEADNGESALTQINYLKPDIALLDLVMPEMDGLTVLKNALDRNAKLIAIIITSYDDKAYLNKALQIGAKGFLLKDNASSDLVNCIEAINRGDIFISPTLGQSHLSIPPKESQATARRAIKQLTQTEIKVLDHIADFLTSKEIGKKLNISYRTVQNHRANIAQKLDIHGAHQVLRFAQKNRTYLQELIES